jgi:hypothetical protein
MANALAAKRNDTKRQRNRRAWRVSGLVLAFAAALVVAAPAAHADRFDRAVKWSGYHWTVRSTKHAASPGHNRWGDSRWNVRVLNDKTLRVNISKGKSVELVGPRTGYGHYHWVVKTDLSTIDPFRVAAFFVSGRGGEQDVEFSRWGHPTLTTAGSWVTWRRHTRLGFGDFAVSPAAPYTIDIDWHKGATRFTVHDASGATLVDTTHRSSRPGRHTAPRISYWVFPGQRANRSPFTAASVHPPIIVQSFKYRRTKG